MIDFGTPSEQRALYKRNLALSSKRSKLSTLRVFIANLNFFVTFCHFFFAWDITENFDVDNFLTASLLVWLSRVRA